MSYAYFYFRLKSNALRISRIIRDVPMKPLEKAVWWVEYVLRHETFCHLQSIGIGNSSLYKKNFDVWVFLFGIFSIGLVSFYKLARLIFSKLIASRRAEKPKAE